MFYQTDARIAQKIKQNIALKEVVPSMEQENGNLNHMGQVQLPEKLLKIRFVLIQGAVTVLRMLVL